MVGGHGVEDKANDVKPPTELKILDQRFGVCFGFRFSVE